MRDYFWRVQLVNGPDEDVDTDYAGVHRNGTLSLSNDVLETDLEPGLEVMYAPGTWRKVLKVHIKESKDRK